MKVLDVQIPFPVQELRVGEITTVEFTQAPPTTNRTACSSLNNAEVPFEQVRPLLVDRPLRRRS